MVKQGGYFVVVVFTCLSEIIGMLETELHEKRVVDEASEYERAKQEVREEAQKSEVNVDILHDWKM